MGGGGTTEPAGPQQREGPERTGFLNAKRREEPRTSPLQGRARRGKNLSGDGFGEPDPPIGLAP